jgi:hypothetical protein
MTCTARFASFAALLAQLPAYISRMCWLLQDMQPSRSCPLPCCCCCCCAAVYRVPDFTGEPCESQEMAPVWMHPQELPYDKMWADDRWW